MVERALALLLGAKVSAYREGVQTKTLASISRDRPLVVGGSWRLGLLMPWVLFVCFAVSELRGFLVCLTPVLIISSLFALRPEVVLRGSELTVQWFWFRPEVLGTSSILSVHLPKPHRARPAEVVLRCEGGRQLRVYVRDAFVAALEEAAGDARSLGGVR